MPNTIAATVSKRISLGGTDYLYLGRLTPDTSYATGGDTITNPTEGPKLPEKIDTFNIEASNGGHVAVYNRTGANAGKVQLYECAGTGLPLKEVAAKANLSTETYSFICIGA